jgi:DNA helicase-2/ATP-dependent DNA helicase PcrA
MTRAKREIYLILSSRRRLFGSLTVNPPSRFLSEIPPDLIQEIELESSESIADPDYPEITEPTVDDNDDF